MLKRISILAACTLLAAPVHATGLTELYQETIRSFPNLIASSAKVDIGEAQARQAFGSLLPQVSVQASLTENKREVVSNGSSDSYGGEKYALVISQPLFDKSKWENSNRYDQLALQRKEEHLDLTAAVAVDLIDRYVKVLAAQDHVVLIQAEREAVSRQLDQLRSRYKRQLAVLTDLLEVEARLDGIRAEEIAALNEVDIAREALAELVGRPVTEPLDPFRDQLEYEEDGQPLAYWIEQGLANNHGLQALLHEVDAARANLRQARAGHYPVLDLQLSAQKSDIGFENALSPTTETYVAALNATLPLYRGGSDSARVDESHAQLVVARQSYEEAKRKALKDIRAAYLNTEASWARIAAARKAVRSAEKSYEAMRKGFEFGTVTVVDVLDALREEHQFRRDYRQAQYDFAVNRMNLLRTSGMLTEEHVRMADGWLSKDAG